MGKVEKIENEIRMLPSQELAAFREWFREFDAEAWGREIEADARGGKLGAPAEAALQADQAGESSPL
jgi:hypothetical protein